MSQQYQITKGDKFLCIEDYTMDDDTIAYSKGKIYQSHKDSCITDNDDCFYHDMLKQEDFFNHFHKIETGKYISETEHLKTIESWKEEERIWIKQLAEKDAEIIKLKKDIELLRSY